MHERGMMHVDSERRAQKEKTAMRLNTVRQGQ